MSTPPSDLLEEPGGEDESAENQSANSTPVGDVTATGEGGTVAALIALVLIAFGLRVALAPFVPTVLYLDVIHFDFESVRRFAAGEFAEGFLHWVPPLYPLLVAGPYALIGDLEWAGRLTGCLVGALTVLPVYALGRVYGGHRVGLLAAIFLVVAPFHVRYSVRVSSHVHYVFFIAIAFWAAAILLRRPSGRVAVFTGAACGLAYWVRQEVVVVVGFLAGTVAFLPALAKRWPRAFPAAPLGRTAVGLALVLVLVFVGYVFPIISWTHDATGHWVLSSKGGVSLFGAGRHLTDLTEDGRRVLWETQIATMDDHRPLSLTGAIAADPTGSFLHWGRNVLKHFGESLLRVFGYVAVPFIAWTFFRRRAVPRATALEGFGLALTVTTVFALSFFYDSPRLCFFLLPFGLIFAAAGSLEFGARWGARGQRVLVALVCIGSLALCGRTVTKFGGSWEPGPEERAGKWIEARLVADGIAPWEGKVMDPSANVSLFARAKPEFFPKTDDAAFVRFARFRGVDYVAFSIEEIDRSHPRWIEPLRSEAEFLGLERVHVVDAEEPDDRVHIFRVLEASDRVSPPPPEER
ncbi:MAG: glycosyltransferase family 39 protein [Planctomycetota bacterium]